uniref:Uncharacterized protein n=1 Tax=Chromera velia CCMP2878 TaxID=1169474 RepID=A0A0G4IBJ4_9ALVE|eukprot:Cvel_2170.t1-p1 / transcript=Cvel_2170.t1 / gene=Cvel_2170 / organism=Chromera_velia_CCMP2878 / gene_product=Ankyrin-1, putative / transcript_product=Ankyrin-1, putative / location=Cvel_scaffold84:39876-42850(-) / protein_length=754 / sequence_SO=supercontig / SO=protein_coding / is_pseudo=false
MTASVSLKATPATFLKKAFVLLFCLLHAALGVDGSRHLSVESERGDGRREVSVRVLLAEGHGDLSCESYVLVKEQCLKDVLGGWKCFLEAECEGGTSEDSHFLQMDMETEGDAIRSGISNDGREGGRSATRGAIAEMSDELMDKADPSSRCNGPGRNQVRRGKGKSRDVSRINFWTREAWRYSMGGRREWKASKVWGKGGVGQKTEKRWQGDGAEREKLALAKRAIAGESAELDPGSRVARHTNDAIERALDISSLLEQGAEGTPVTVRGDLDGAVPTCHPTCVRSSPRCAGLWYKLRLPEWARSAVLDTCNGTDFDTVLFVVSGSNCTHADTGGECQCEGLNDDACGLQSRVEIRPLSSREYFVRVWQYDEGMGNGSFVLSVTTLSSLSAVSLNEELLLSATRGNARDVEAFLQEGADVNTTDPQTNRTPLHMAVSNGHLEVTVLLLREGAAVDAVDNRDMTPLHLASLSGQAEIVEALLYRNASLDARGVMQSTPLHLAALQGHVQVVEVLVNRHASVQNRTALDATPLHLAVEMGHPEVVEVLLAANASVEERDQKQRTPLHLAAEMGHAEVVEVLLAANASVEERDQEQETPLHLAAKNGHLEVAELLLSRNAFVDAREASYLTPLRFAAQFGHSDVVELLLNKNATVDATNDRGWTSQNGSSEWPLGGRRGASEEKCLRGSDEWRWDDTHPCCCFEWSLECRGVAFELQRLCSSARQHTAHAPPLRGPQRPLGSGGGAVKQERFGSRKR